MGIRNVLKKLHKPPVQLGGRCGHDKDRPKFDIIDSMQALEGQDKDIFDKKIRPLILRFAMGQLRDVYFHPKEHSRFAFQLTKNGKITKCHNANLRQIKSNAREADILLLATMLLHMDLNTLLVGYYDKEHKFHPYTLQYLANQAGISIDRAKDSFRRWKQRGMLVSEPEWAVCTKNDDDTYKGHAKPKLVAKHLFAYLGIDAWLKEERDRASERLSKLKEEGIAHPSKRDQAANAARSDVQVREIARLAAKVSVNPEELPRNGDFRGLMDILKGY